MTKRGSMGSAALLAAVVLAVTPVAGQESEPNPVQAFAVTMIRGIGAEETSCEPDIQRQVELRRMNIVCARFDGTFSRFEIRWDLEMLQRERPDARFPGTIEPPVLALTDWEASEGEYDRIYRVAGKAIGVRFGHGDVVMVW